MCRGNLNLELIKKVVEKIFLASANALFSRQNPLKNDKKILIEQTKDMEL